MHGDEHDIKADPAGWMAADGQVLARSWQLTDILGRSVFKRDGGELANPGCSSTSRMSCCIPGRRGTRSAASLCARPAVTIETPEGDRGLMLTEIATAEGGILVVGRSAASL